MKTFVVVFPFDLFGSSGTGRGAELLADALREMLADNRRERRPTRSAVYQDHIRLREFSFETMDNFAEWRATARRAVKQARKRGDFLLWLTGNHLGALPVYEEWGADRGPVVQFDAHLDVYNLADCTEELSHGNFLAHAERPLPPIINVGHRDLFLTDARIREHFRDAFPVEAIECRPTAVRRALGKLDGAPRQVLIDIDCDVFDPAFFPAAAQTQPMGLSPREVLGLIDAVGWDRVGGLCLSEFDPARDVRDQSLATLVWLMEYVLLKLYER